MIDKKASIELSFNWIYVALIGGLVIIGTIIIIGNMKRQASEDHGANVKESLNLILENTKNNANGEQEIDLAGSEILFDCYGYSLKGSDSSRISLGDKAIFSPDLIKQQMLAFGNLLSFNKVRIGYVTSPDIKYLFYDSPYTKQLFSIFPENTNKDIISNYDAFENNNFYKVRYISFEDAPALSGLGNLKNLDNADVSFVKITILQDIIFFPESIGKVEYFEKGKTAFEFKGESFFIDKSTLLGAVVSENKELYECSLSKALASLHMSLGIDKDRLNDLSIMKNSKACSYSKTLEDANELDMLIKDGDILQEELSKISILKKSLQKDNDYLKRLSCQMLK